METRNIRVIFSKIGLKLVIPYLIISFLTLILITGLIYYNYKIQTNSIKEVQEEISLKASSEINYYIKNIVDELSLFSKEIGKTNRFEKNLNTKSLKNLIEHDPSIYSLSITSIKGDEISKLVRYDIKASSELKDISSEEKFKKAIEGNHYLSSVYISEYDLPFFSISLPIEDEQNTIIGVLSAEVDLSPMWGTTSRIRVKKTGYVYVVDQYGKLIAYKDVNLVKKNLDLKQIQGVKNFLADIHKSETYTSFNDEKVIGTWESIDVVNWGVIVELPTKEIFQELSMLFFIAGFSVVVSVLLVIIILIIIFKKVLKPISYLKEGVMEVKNGNLGYHMKITGQDELGELASAFNQMTGDLKASHAQLIMHQKELEKTVVKRTKELQSKLEELEKFSKLSIGRELKMVELKKRIAELEKNKKNMRDI